MVPRLADASVEKGEQQPRAPGYLRRRLGHRDQVPHRLRVSFRLESDAPRHTARSDQRVVLAGTAEL
jgi:hypothetical protein